MPDEGPAKSHEQQRGDRKRVALVTGSTRGIGFGIASRLARDGFAVVVNGRASDSAEHSATAIRTLGGDAIGLGADVGLAAPVDELFDRAEQRLGAIDVVINNAAFSNSSAIAHFLDTTEDHWDSILRTNLKGAYLCSHRAALSWFGSRRPGCIINISSFGAQRAHRSMAAYDAAKGGIDALTRAMALDLAPFGIRVNAVAPGAVDVEEHLRADPEVQAARARPIPLGRTGTPDDVASLVSFLVSEEAAYITGQVLAVDGGVLAQLRTPDVDIPVPVRFGAER